MKNLKKCSFFSSQSWLSPVWLPWKYILQFSAGNSHSQHLPSCFLEFLPALVTSNVPMNWKESLERRSETLYVLKTYSMEKHRQLWCYQCCKICVYCISRNLRKDAIMDYLHHQNRNWSAWKFPKNVISEKAMTVGKPMRI